MEFPQVSTYDICSRKNLLADPLNSLFSFQPSSRDGALYVETIPPLVAS